MPSGGVRASVCSSVTFVYYVETAKRNIELCPPSASTTVRILPNVMAIFRHGSPTGSYNARKAYKSRDLHKYKALSQK